MSFRVIQWATGGVGRAAMEGVLDHPDLELVGAWVHSPAKEGSTSGRSWAGATSACTPPATSTPCWPPRPSASSTARSWPTRPWWPPSSRRARTSSPHSAGSTPDRGAGAVRRRRHEGRRHPARHGDPPRGHHRAVPAHDLCPVGVITHVRAEEFSDIRTYGAPDVVRDWMLFGKTPEEARASIMIDALGAGFRQSIFMVADELGFDIEPQLRTTHEMAVATAPIDSPIGPIQPGTVAAQRFKWEADVDGEPVVTAAVNWLMGEEHLDPAWGFGAGR